MIRFIDRKNKVYSKLKELHSKKDNKDYIKDLIDSLNYDVGLLIKFSNENTIFEVKQEYFSNDIFVEETLNSGYLNNRDFEILRLLTNERKILILNNNKKINQSYIDYYPLIKDISNEILIPIFRECDPKSEVIGCIYLGTFNVNSIISDDKLEEDSIVNIIFNILNQFQNDFLRNENISNLFDKIHLFTNILQTKRRYFGNHSYNVAHWAKEIAKSLDLSLEKIESVYLAGIMHDLGKIYLDDAILNKPGKLTDEEYKIVKKSPIYGYNITKELLKNYSRYSDIPNIIKHQHERYDGFGYPDGLKEDEIPIESCILFIADVVDTMFSEKTYEKAKSIDEVIIEIKNNKNHQFHPSAVDKMINILANYRNQQEEIFTNKVSQANITIIMRDKTIIREGTLIKLSHGYLFKPNDNDIIEDDNTKIIKADLYIHDRLNIYEYDVIVNKISDGNFYISSLKMKQETNSFLLLWRLQGMISLGKVDETSSILINKISANDLTFYFDNNGYMNELINRTAAIRIIFEKDSNVDVVGKITKKYIVGDRMYYHFQYLNIPDVKRDAIYKHLFKKQVEMRKNIFTVATIN